MSVDDVGSVLCFTADEDKLCKAGAKEMCVSTATDTQPSVYDGISTEVSMATT